MKIINTKTSLRNYSIFIKKNIIDDAPDIIKKHFPGAERIVLVTNHYAGVPALIMRLLNWMMANNIKALKALNIYIQDSLKRIYTEMIL